MEKSGQIAFQASESLPACPFPTDSLFRMAFKPIFQGEKINEWSMN